jgi:hypothetical protein
VLCCAVPNNTLLAVTTWQLLSLTTGKRTGSNMIQTATNACLQSIHIPYLRVYKPHFLTIIDPPKLGCGLCTEYYVLFTTEPATPVLYVVKIPLETASVWDCYLASCCIYAKTPTYYWCIGMFWLHESSRHHRFPEVGRPWHHRQITTIAASDNQSAANTITNILLSHR